MVLHPSPFNLSVFVKEMAENFAPSFAASGCSVKLIMLKDDIYVDWDKTRIQEVLANLLTNAMRYAPRSQVTMTVKQTLEKKVVISVEDKGPGIPLEKQDKIFDRFQSKPSPSNASGMGLGLFIVKHIVEAHHGTVALESKQGQGAKFTLELPLHLNMPAAGGIPDGR